ncbi:MAG: DsrE family protein [Verrucomicrobiales bacterium]|nr:DsrE family protein [Verrucomicrobiales bacterium]
MKKIQHQPLIRVVALLLAGISPPLDSSLFAQSSPTDEPAKSSEAKATVVVNITSGIDDLHAACMGIGLARTAIESGRRAVIFLNVNAPALAAADLPAGLKFADFPPVKGMLADFVAAGGELYVCGHCAAICTVDESKLIEGAVISHHEDLFKKLPASALSFSY